MSRFYLIGYSMTNQRIWMSVTGAAELLTKTAREKRLAAAFDKMAQESLLFPP